MAQFGGNKNPPWARGNAPGGPPSAVEMQAAAGLMGPFGGQAGPPVFHQAPPGLPPGLAALGAAGHNPAVTLGGMPPGSQVRRSLRSGHARTSSPKLPPLADRPQTQ